MVDYKLAAISGFRCKDRSRRIVSPQFLRPSKKNIPGRHFVYVSGLGSGTRGKNSNYRGCGDPDFEGFGIKYEYAQANL